MDKVKKSSKDKRDKKTLISVSLSFLAAITYFWRGVAS